jgi:hypothetical protein
MTKGSAAKPGRKKDGAGDGPPAWARPRLKPQKRLFLGLLCLLIAWVGFLLFIYFKSVYPRTHPHTRIPANFPTS